MNQLKKFLPHILIALGLLTFYYFRYQRAPDLELDSIQFMSSDGSVHRADELFKGKTALHFYASWCGPCLQEMKDIRDHFAFYQDKDISFIFVTDDSWEKIRPFEDAMPAEIKFYHISSLKEVGIYSIPTNYFLENKNILLKKVEKMNWSNPGEIMNIYTRKK